MKKISLILLSTVILVVNVNDSFAANNRRSSVRTFGDYFQIVNPIIGSIISSQERGWGHFAFIYGQHLVTVHGVKLIGKSGKWNISKRPHIKNKKDRYEGMPSGHTTSAWSAAAYARTFFEDYKLVSVPLYVTALFTGYSRVKSKEHTVLQVIAGAALSELIVFGNSKLNWSNSYKSTSFHFNPKGGVINFKFSF